MSEWVGCNLGCTEQDSLKSGPPCAASRSLRGWVAMRRTGWAGVILAGALVGGPGCRTCEDRPGLFHRLFHRDHCDTPTRLSDRPANCDPCASGYPTARPTSGTYPYGAPVFPSSWSGDLGSSYPVYPAGQPLPNPSAGVPPANELPYPTIPAPGVPDGTAQPTPAIPGALGPVLGARVTSDTKK